MFCAGARWTAAGIAALLVACTPARETSQRPLVAVSVEPQAWFVERLAGDMVEVAVMIPPGTSPASFEPGIPAMRALDRAALYVTLGHPNFPFEKAWLQRLLQAEGAPPAVDCLQGVEVSSEDPHVWLSPALAGTMASCMARAMAELLPEAADAIADNHRALQEEIRATDAAVAEILAPVRGRTVVVFHPAWSGLTSAYGLRQLAIEQDHKEPDARELGLLIQQARTLEVPVIFAQPQFDTASANTLAGEIGASVELIDPLARDWPSNLRSVARHFAEAAR